MQLESPTPRLEGWLVSDIRVESSAYFMAAEYGLAEIEFMKTLATDLRNNRLLAADLAQMMYLMFHSGLEVHVLGVTLVPRDWRQPPTQEVLKSTNGKAYLTLSYMWAHCFTDFAYQEVLAALRQATERRWLEPDLSQRVCGLFAEMRELQQLISVRELDLILGVGATKQEWNDWVATQSR